MSQKKAPTDEELLAQFEDIPSADAAPPPPASASKSKGAKSTPAAAAAAVAAPVPAGAGPQTEDDDDDPLAELSALAAARPASRPETPRLPSSNTSGTRTTKAEHTPSSSGPPSQRSSEDRLRTAQPPSQARKSTDSTRSYHQSFGPESTSEGVNKAEQHEEKSSSSSSSTNSAGTGGGGGGGWWGMAGSVFSVATAAVKQAEAAVKEVRDNAEVLKYAEQLRGNADKLRQYGDNLRHQALPSFQVLMETLAPPISAHERLQIHTTHDMLGYPSLDPLIYAVFARVMSQVEGGDLLVMQRGSESRARSDSDGAYRGTRLGGGGTGWTDGPWWRDNARRRDLGAVRGLVAGTKLCRASAEGYADDFFAARGGLEQAAKAATEAMSETMPVRSSDIFLAIQAITLDGQKDLFARGPSNKQSEGEASADDTAASAADDDDDQDSDTTAFAIFLHDPVHSLTFHTVSQSFPSKWAHWLDAGSSVSEDDTPTLTLPSSIEEIIAQGGIDPREWIAEWLEELLSLSIGVIAQRYVAKRMGVGEGGAYRGRVRAADYMSGEAARAI